jgi:enediyne biosynthesis protein E4
LLAGLHRRKIHSAGSYLSENDLRAHFCLGTATKIDKLEVRWPSGAVDVIKDLMVHQFYGVLEGRGWYPLIKFGHR